MSKLLILDSQLEKDKTLEQEWRKFSTVSISVFLMWCIIKEAK